MLNEATMKLRRELRDSKGRFVSGNPGGPGRPRIAIPKHLRDALISGVPWDKWQSLINSTIDAATDGDARARAWIGRLLFGSRLTTLAADGEKEQQRIERERELNERMRQSCLRQLQRVFDRAPEWLRDGISRHIGSIDFDADPQAAMPPNDSKKM